MKKINKKGFTLIEVVLVLAIGGLIFLLAFLAFRNASVNRRDSERRSDASRIVAEVANYSGDRSGAIPTAATASGDACAGSGTTSFNGFLDSYLCEDNGTKFQDPLTGSNYSVVTSSPTGEGQIQYVLGSGCDGAGQFHVNMGLEKGVVCRDSGN